ncbi:RDD family protein [Aestuariibacter halophilus]|uniref:RDD family protein n=1 Tax=Fluctibacter halophilus TaxID=226011 RepID=A0ABS8G8T7_9ALTE|nr:RDD family protein [Aestuariibacter halophilus]MCC2615616.1 RDD family protein [Aestuariibacter halophilus]
MTTNNYHPTTGDSETREIVTPFAFSVSPELLGTPLASPMRRGFALGIDMLLISMLTHVNSLFLAGLLAIMFFRAGNRLKQKKRYNGLRLLLRSLAALMLFLFALATFESVFDAPRYGPKIPPGVVTYGQDDSVGGLDGLKLVGLTAGYGLEIADMYERVERGECKPAFTCWQTISTDIADVMVETALPEDKARGLFDAVHETASDQLTAEEQLALKAHFEKTYTALKTGETAASEATSDDDTSVTEKLPDTVKDDKPATSATDETPEHNFGYSLIEWAKGIAADLGLGFGWAAFYFSALTTWLNGQTPGKKALGIKVVKLDNSRLNLWESFGRYGGYGAGFATGLMGFLQVFWDPNRQAIQDKISETLVINLRKPKQSLGGSSDVKPSV